MNDKPRARNDSSQVGVLGGSDQVAVRDIVDAIVADQMMRNSLEGHTACLLEKAMRFDIGRSNSGLDWSVSYNSAVGDHGGRDREGVVGTPVGGLGVTLLLPFTLLGGTRIFFEKGRRLEFVIYEEAFFIRYEIRSPEDAILPVPDARRLHLINKDVTAPDEVVALAIMYLARAVIEPTRQAGLKEDESIHP